MKSFAAIGFLLLLLYQMIGLPLAVLTFDQAYESATDISANDHWKLVKLPISLPYTTSWDNPDGQEGLIKDGDEFYNIVHQRYANDTLYTLLKTNQGARERFFDLADQLQHLDDEQQSSSKSPLSRLVKLLKDRLTTYLPPAVYGLDQPVTLLALFAASYGDLALLRYGVDLSPTSPPPQQ